MNTETLESFGLLKKEIEVYVMLVRLGSSLASQIAEKTNLQRTYVYDILKKLIKKGLVSFIIRENRKYFQAVEPKKLINLWEEKDEKLKEEKNKMKAIIKEMEKISYSKEERLIASVYEGKKGFRVILEEILDTNKDYFVIGYSGKADELLEFYLPNFHKRRIKQKIRRKIIFNHEIRNTKSTQLSLQETKFLPKKYSSLSGTIIYGDKVVLVVVQEKNFVALMIENKKINKSFRKNFELLWKVSKR